MAKRNNEVQHINGILLLYHHLLRANAPTIKEHVDALPNYSSFPVWKVNTECGFPRNLSGLRFDAIVLHYSIGVGPYLQLGNEFSEYIVNCSDSYKIAFFQDEYRHWPARSQFMNDHEIDCVYTLVEPEYFDCTYRKYRPDLKLHYTLTGYVDEQLTRRAARYSKPDAQKTIDIGYRARSLPITMGRGALEKHDIAVQFKNRTAGLGLKLDIETAEEKRIYGEAWYKDFLANCRGVLGVEAGVSIFDVDHEAVPKYEAMKSANPELTDDEAHRQLLHRYEDKIFYRTISPRHFEAAAFKVCQILFEGHYSGILKPHVHYIPLKKDYSNLDEVLCTFQNADARHEITTAAYRDIIESGNYDYRTFTAEFDQNLLSTGLKPGASSDVKAKVQALLDEDLPRRQYRATYLDYKRHLNMRRVVGRSLIRAAAKPVLWLKSQKRRSEYC